MTKTIDCYYSLVSPWSFVGHERLIEIAKRHGAAINFMPVNLGKLFPATGGTMFKDRHPARLAYRMTELVRWNKYLNFGLNVQPKYFPVPDMLAAALVIEAGKRGHDVASLSLAYMRATWKEERNIADPETVIAIANEQGLDGQTLLAASGEGSPALLQWEANTGQAIQRGVHGVPWYVYNDEPFWGQDRLDFLDRALAS